MPRSSNGANGKNSCSGNWRRLKFRNFELREFSIRRRTIARSKLRLRNWERNSPGKLSRGSSAGEAQQGKLSRGSSAGEAQQQAGREVRAECSEEVPCPTCPARCRVETKSRNVTSIDGSVTVDEAVATCRKCRRSFFPQRTELGFDPREVTPGLVRAIGHLAADVRSFERTRVVVGRVLRVKISDTTIGRIVRQVGSEIAQTLVSEERTDGKDVVVPQIATVSCDGGRIRTREAGAGRGVTLANESGWRETKNATFEKMVPHDEHRPGIDPCVRWPTTFRGVKNVANMCGKTGSGGVGRRGRKCS